MHQVAVQGQLLDQTMGLVEHGHAGRLVDTPALHAHETVLDHVEQTHAVAPTDLVERLHDAEGAELLSVHRHGRALGKSDRDPLGPLRRVLRLGDHAEIDQLDTARRKILEPAGFVADVQTILVRAVGLLDGRLDGNVLLAAIGDHLAAAGELLAKPLDPPRGDYPNRRIERLGRQLEPALVVSLAGSAVDERLGADLSGDLEADFRDQRPSDRSAQQIDALVFRLELHHRQGEIPAEFFPGVDQPSRLGAQPSGLFHDRLAVFARLAQIDVDGVDFMAFVAKPGQQHRGVQSARVSKYTARHKRHSFTRRVGTAHRNPLSPHNPSGKPCILAHRHWADKCRTARHPTRFAAGTGAAGNLAETLQLG